MIDLRKSLAFYAFNLIAFKKSEQLTTAVLTELLKFGVDVSTGRLDELEPDSTVFYDEEHSPEDSILASNELDFASVYRRIVTSFQEGDFTSLELLHAELEGIEIETPIVEDVPVESSKQVAEDTESYEEENSDSDFEEASEEDVTNVETTNEESLSEQEIADANPYLNVKAPNIDVDASKDVDIASEAKVVNLKEVEDTSSTDDTTEEEEEQPDDTVMKSEGLNFEDFEERATRLIKETEKANTKPTRKKFVFKKKK